MRVLIIEDNKRIAELIKKGLEQESFAVDLAFDGEQGLDLAATEDYDVIILDIMLPKIDGVSVCKELREKYKIKTPILMLTAKGQIDDKIEGFNAGADDYLVKPFAFEELLVRIRALLRRPKGFLNDVLQISDLYLDVVNLKVKRGNKEIKLSKREFALLEYLMRNKNRVVSKDQILSHVWSFNSDILPNTVEVYIASLRKKIDKAFPDRPPLIHTVRGFGYKISEKQDV